MLVNHNTISYRSIELTRSHLFSLYFVEKNSWGGELMEIGLREVK